MSEPRDPYEEVGPAARDALARAIELRITRWQWQVLGAVLQVTALYSRLQERVLVDDIAERAGLHPENARRALKELSALGVIDWQPQWGGKPSDRRSLVGLTSPRQRPAAVLVTKAAEIVEPRQRKLLDQGSGQPLPRRTRSTRRMSEKDSETRAHERDDGREKSDRDDDDEQEPPTRYTKA